MSFARRDQLIVEYSTRYCTLTDRDKDAYEEDLVLLARVVESFPTASLHVEITRHPRSGGHEVKLDLVLARRLNVFASEVGEHPRPAFKRCVRSLIARVQAFKERRSAHERGGQAEVPAQHVRAPVEPDLERLQAAVDDGDYPAFRDEIAVHRETLQKRIGRRIELQPDAAAMLGDDLTVDECVEEVFLNAFEAFDRRPAPPESLGEWLETLIDGSIRELVEHPEEERRNISFARSAQGAR